MPLARMHLREVAASLEDSTLLCPLSLENNRSSSLVWLQEVTYNDLQDTKKRNQKFETNRNKINRIKIVL